MKLVKGDKLAPETRREVLNAFVYRLTSENGYPARNPCGARVPAISDTQWLSEHAFYVRVDGKLARNRRHAEPCFLAED
jgi:hypothetical protein